jgi:hypothetical protein
MATLLGYLMVQKNKHLPEEIYREIMGYLVPKYLLHTPEIKQYNKVVADIPGFDTDITPKRILTVFGTPFRTVKFIYRLKREWKNITKPHRRNTIIVHLPFTGRPFLTHHYIEQYNIYHLLQASGYQREKRTKRDLHKAKYGI